MSPQERLTALLCLDMKCKSCKKELSNNKVEFCSVRCSDFHYEEKLREKEMIYFLFKEGGKKHWWLKREYGMPISEIRKIIKEMSKRKGYPTSFKALYPPVDNLATKEMDLV